MEVSNKNFAKTLKASGYQVLIYIDAMDYRVDEKEGVNCILHQIMFAEETKFDVAMGFPSYEKAQKAFERYTRKQAKIFIDYVFREYIPKTA